jgi:hypothetical protein
MLTARNCLQSLSAKGVRLWVDGEQLRYHARSGILTPEDLTQLRRLKNEIITELRGAWADRAPLSYQQRCFLELTMLQKTRSRSLVYAFRLTGGLDLKTLGASIETIVCRHSVLRTRIVDSNGVLEQYSDAIHAFPLRVVCATGKSEVEIDDHARQLIREAADRELDTAIGPVFDVTLIETSGQIRYLSFVFHRLAADCLAASQLFRELWQLYAESLAAPGSSVPREPLQYRDYALWQQATDASWRQNHMAFWSSRLANATYVRWPAAYPLSGSPGSLGKSQLPFGPSLSAGLRDLGRKARTLYAMVLLTVYAAVISRWCGQRDFVLPFNIAGRHSEHENIIGNFSSPLYLRMQLDGDETYASLLSLVSREFYRAVSHQDFGRMAIRTPELLQGTLFQWMSWNPDDISGAVASDLAAQLGIFCEDIHFQEASELTSLPPALVQIEMNFFETEHGIVASAIYRTDLFAPDFMQRLLEQLRTSAERFVLDQLARAIEEVP